MNSELPLSWGACKGYARKYNGTAKGTEWIKFETIVEGSTNLDVTEGDKTEATIEGGEVEAVRRAKNKYAIVFEERVGNGHVNKLDAVDGVVDGTFEFVIVPTESTGAAAIYLPKCNASVLESYTSEEGIKEQYTFSALKNDVTDTKGKELGQAILGIATLTAGVPSAFNPFQDSEKNLLA